MAITLTARRALWVEPKTVSLAARAKPARPSRWDARPALSRGLTLALLVAVVVFLGAKGVLGNRGEPDDRAGILGFSLARRL